MSSGDAKADILRDKIVEELNRELTASENRSALATNYLERSQDYRTLVMMNELPAHAALALEAWQSMLPDAATERLLTLLADAYAEAARQAGQ